LTEPGIVTPEAVVLSFETAGIGSRLIAKLIDLAVQGAALVLVLWAGAILSLTRLGQAGIYFGVFLVVFGYPVTIETLWRGRTLGKAAMGLRVVTVDGAPIHFRHALVRDALGLIDFYVTGGAAAVLTVLATKRSQRLGDLVGGTLVLRERLPRQVVTAVAFWVPPGWEGYAATLDVSALGGADYEVVRSFLLRTPTLDPWTRDRLAREIATAIAPRLRHQPPPGVQAEMFLVCVAALYQQRQRYMTGPVVRTAAPTPTGAPAPTVAPPAVAPAGPIANGDGFRAPD